MADKFVLIRETEYKTGETVTNPIAVSDTLLGAQKFGTKTIRKHYGQDVFFNPVGWGTSETDWFYMAAEDTDRNGIHKMRMLVRAIPFVSQRTTV